MSHVAGKGTRVAKKRSVGRYPLEFKKMAVEQLKMCDNVVALAEELGVHRRMLYRWHDELMLMDYGDGPPENIRERDLRNQLTTVKRLLAAKALEVDFLCLFTGLTDF